MAILDTMAKVSGILQNTGAALSLVSLAKIFISSPGISATPGQSFLSGQIPLGVTVFGRSPNLDVITRDQLKNRAQITDHFTEENYTIQDHVAFEPSRYTLTGEVGELVFAQSNIEKYAQAVLDRLGPLDIISPELSLSAYRFLSEYSRLTDAVMSVAGQVSDIAGMFGLGEEFGFGLNKQQKAFRFFDALFQNRIVVAVDTPWKTYPSMLIEDFDVEQGEESKHVSTFTVNFKEFRTVSAVAGLGPLKGKIAAQAAGVAEKGVSKGTAGDVSWLKQMIGG